MRADGKISNFMQVAAVKRYTLTDDAMSGLKAIEADNGVLRVLLNESKALDLMQLFAHGENISFLSKNAFTTRETAFEKRFEGGMLYTCGLDALGEIAGHEMHGSLHNLPAQVLQARCDENGILIEAEMRDSALFGKNLRLRRKVQMEIGGNSLIIEDELCNDGFETEDYCLLYHINLGYPFLDEGTHLVWDTNEIIPRNAAAERKKTECTKMSVPEIGQEENCYFVTLNRPEVKVVSPKCGKAFTLTYSGDTLPHFIEWKSMRSGDYALGLEPCTSLLDDKFSYSRIGRGERKRFCIKMTLDKLSGEEL